MNDIIPGAEQAARRTAAMAALADFRREEVSGQPVPWAMWAGRLAAALDSVLATPPTVQEMREIFFPEDPEGRQAQDEAGKLAEIRAVLAAFDWEFDDRQLALEHIERIVEAGQ